MRKFVVKNEEKMNKNVIYILMEIEQKIKENQRKNKRKKRKKFFVLFENVFFAFGVVCLVVL